MRFASQEESCLLFPSLDSALACRSFLTSPQHGEGSVSLRSILIKKLSFNNAEVKRHEGPKDVVSDVGMYAVFFPRSGMGVAMNFWRLTGLGISSRFAEQCLAKVPDLQHDTIVGTSSSPSQQAGRFIHHKLCTRIVKLLKRSPVEPSRVLGLSSDDVYLYQSGMAAIYQVHRSFLWWRGARSVVFGFTYELTLKMLETYGPGCRFYAFGNDDELTKLETYLDEKGAKEVVQAVWCECPSNPLLRTPDLKRLRALADKHNFILVIDDMIGSFSNVDLFGVADILITSLTKSFSGFCNVMGGRYVSGRW